MMAWLAKHPNVKMAVWTSLRPQVSDPMVSYFFEKSMRDLLFVNDSKIYEESEFHNYPFGDFQVPVEFDFIRNIDPQFGSENILNVSVHANPVFGYVR